ncbi:hypothetical protein Tco_1124435 [Tanacetum coccineum]|uniref:Reverse transcriptase domain-containing protein n=1 Tax=Tanacetum coccineum TaxID=301880 RepID=A0ABQ5J7K9_9ASTR
MRIEKRVPAGQQKPQAKEGRTLGNSFEATLRVLANVSKKSKKNGTPPTAKAACRIPKLKSCMTQKTTMTRADTGSPKSIVNEKTYDGTGDPDDHLKIFQAAAKIERELLATKEVHKDPMEIHHIKQREGESTKAFMERFKAKSMHVSGAPECMKILGFMDEITNPDLIKKLNDNIPKSVDEMTSVTTAFLRGEAPPPMTGPVKNWNKNIFYEFHSDKGHNTDECIHLRRQIEEAVKLGQLLHLPWQRITRQKTTKSFSTDQEISFSALGDNSRQETPIVIKAEVEGHIIHRMSPSLYNGIIGRPGLRKIQAVPSTAHGMLKFPVKGGIVTIHNKTIIPAECRIVTEAQDVCPPKELVVTEGSKVAIHPEYPDQTVMIDRSLSKKDE